MVTDIPRIKYEKLRKLFFEANQYEQNIYWNSFRLFGIYGLFENNQAEPHIIEVHQAHPQRWCGATDPCSLILHDAFMQLINPDGNRNFLRSYQQ